MAFGTQDDTDEVMNEINMTPFRQSSAHAINHADAIQMRHAQVGDDNCNIGHFQNHSHSLNRISAGQRSEPGEFEKLLIFGQNFVFIIDKQNA